MAECNHSRQGDVTVAESWRIGGTTVSENQHIWQKWATRTGSGTPSDQEEEANNKSGKEEKLTVTLAEEKIGNQPT